jgi:ADP-ribose pyrophosphatase
MSHLIPTAIVDKNGRQTTVHKKQDTAHGDASGAIPVLGATPSGSTLRAQPIAENNPTEGTGVVFANRYLKVDLVPSRFGPFTTIKNGTGGGAAVLVVRDGKVLMVSQPRYATGEVNWEIPRGGANEGEDFADAALRELKEETGEEGTLEGLVSLGNIQPDTGILNTEAGLFISTSNSASESVSDGEIDSLQWVDVDEVVEACVDGTIKDSFTCVAVMRARLRGLL